MNLLIVNDEVIAAKGTMTGISWRDYGIDQVDVAFEAETAKKKLTEGHFDILLCDIEMPGENGVELVRWVRREQLELEVIFLTCHADFEFAQEAVRLQCRNYILIPAAYEVIAENVREVAYAIEKHRENQKKQMYGQMWIAEKEQEQTLQTIARSPETTVENMEKYIGEHLNDPELTISKIAAQLYMNADYLNRVFKRERGESVGRYILKKRMEVSGELLKDGKLGTMKIAELVGYNTYSAFVAAFKNYYGVAPSKFQQTVSGTRDRDIEQSVQ